jgi:zinc transport system substrate-binding protein
MEEINVVTMHDAFPYFAQDMGINIVDIIQRNEEESPTPKELIDITKNIKENNVKGICIEPQYSDKVANLLSGETGVEIYTLDSIVTGEIDKEEYINKMRQNIEVIKGLAKKTS